MIRAALTKRLAALEAENEELLGDMITLKAAVEVVREVMMTRAGEPVTEELATERARNIVTALAGLRVGR